MPIPPRGTYVDPNPVLPDPPPGPAVPGVPGVPGVASPPGPFGGAASVSPENFRLAYRNAILARIAEDRAQRAGRRRSRLGVPTGDSVFARLQAAGFQGGPVPASPSLPAVAPASALAADDDWRRRFPTLGSLVGGSAASAVSPPGAGTGGAGGGGSGGFF